MKKEKKPEAVKKAEKVIGEAKVAVVTDYRGMTVADIPTESTYFYPRTIL